MATTTCRRTAMNIIVVLAGLQLAYAQNSDVQHLKIQLSEFQAEQQDAFEAERAQISDYFQLHNINVDGGLSQNAARFVDGKIRFIESLAITPDAAETSNIHLVWPTGAEGFSLDGSSQVVGVWDGGRVRNTHVEFTVSGVSRVIFGDNYPVFDQHASSIGGVIGAAGVNPDVRGMARGATILSHDWGNDRAEMAAAAANGMSISNHAYGSVTGWGPNMTIGGLTLPAWYGDTFISEEEDPGFGQYAFDSSKWDELALLAPTYLMVKAAGNDRGRGEEPGTEHWAYSSDARQWSNVSTIRPLDGGSDGFDSLIGDAGTSKNVLTVGAADILTSGYSGPEDVGLQWYSAWGPTDDGRIKPDIVSVGQSVRAVKSLDDANYGWLSGTSLASAVTTGGATLVYDRFSEVEYPTPLSSTMKALLIHSAMEAGPMPGPDYMYGWGLMDIFAAVNLVSLDALAGGDTHIFERTLDNNQALTLGIESAGDKPLVVTIAWIDQPGSYDSVTLDSPTLRLVNDLDLRITGPGGSYQPWVLNPATPSSPATLGDNIRDNVEQVVIAEPAQGAYQIRISHKGTLVGGSQSVSIIVGGNFNPVLYSDSDGDSIYSIYEDVDGDGNIFDDDNNFNGTPDYLDWDDDGDGLSTLLELNGCISEGMPVDPPDTNRNGIPDYLDQSTLPVELVSFNGTILPDGATLEWTTASEIDVAGFSIEHAPEDFDFVERAFVSAIGNSVSDQLYRQRIDNLPPGHHRFRLSTLDMDGTVTVGPVLELTFDLHAGVEITSAYPNPFRESCRISVTAAKEQDVTIDLVDLLGREVRRINGHLEAMSPWRVSVDGSGLPAGAYVLRVTGDTFTQSKPVTILN